MIFVDTGAFLARYLKHDQHHVTARRAWDSLHRSAERCATSSFVLAETFTLLGRRAGYPFAAERARFIYASPSFTILRSEARDEMEALALFEKYADQQVSFTDCVSFALMRSHRLRRAFSFDRHFALAGFLIWP